MKPYRISAMFLRHIYLYKHSLTRLVEIFYWPLLDLLVWGFVSLYITKLSAEGKSTPNFLGIFLGALILWDILFRSQQGISVSFLEEVWARNFLNLFVSPLTIGEYLASLMMVAVFKVVVVFLISSLLAWLLYSFNLFIIGMYLLPFMICLVILGWAIGILTTGLILRFGQQAEVLAWGVAFLFQPISAVFYPVSVLPKFLQKVALAIPASYVFEGMRAIIFGRTFPAGHLVKAFGLDLVYLLLALFFFFRMFRQVRAKGLLAKMGE
ncbi:MAG: ABC transporter permease [Candidatus Saccharicenans sp.]|jgi:ABC-2 type transport system permease protein|nr:ABC transporter permease [Candidatus Saccharicenans sp.]MDH7575163.1 ABC transporter permease [Candidatus Saccharicenans sp.]